MEDYKKATKKQIRYNRVLAEYLYPKFVKPSENVKKLNLKHCGNSYYTFIVLYTEDWSALNFHRSWDKLIPILQKILKDDLLKINTPSWHAYNIIENMGSNLDLKTLYEAAYIFIKFRKATFETCCLKPKRNWNGGCENCEDPSY